MSEDLFDLSVAESESDFIHKGLSLEGEVASDILAVLGEFPYIGGAIRQNWLFTIDEKSNKEFLKYYEN